jgi:hypothetical protein
MRAEQIIEVGRQIKEMCGFSTVSACDKRLKALIEAGYLERKKYIYGVAGLYTLTHNTGVLVIKKILIFDMCFKRSRIYRINMRYFSCFQRKHTVAEILIST